MKDLQFWQRKKRSCPSAPEVQKKRFSLSSLGRTRGAAIYRSQTSQRLSTPMTGPP